MQQKRVLCDTLHKLHRNFLSTVVYKISLATFCRFKPSWITWQNMNKRNTCKCVQHASIELIKSKLHEVKTSKFCTMTAVLASLTWNLHSTKCTFRECSIWHNLSCTTYQSLTILLPSDNGFMSVRLKRMEKKSQSVCVYSLLKIWKQY